MDNSKLTTEEEDLPLEVQEHDQEIQQIPQNTEPYESVKDDELWIARALAHIKVYSAIAEDARGPEKMEQERTAKKKAQFLEIFRKNLGTIGVACDKCDIDRTTFYDWKRTDPQFKSAIAKIEDERLDMVEDELFELIKKHDGPSIRFYMERINPKYKAKSQTEIFTGEKTLEDILYEQAEKRRIIQEGGTVKKEETNGQPTQ